MLGRRPGGGGCGLSPALQFGDSNGFRTTTATAAGCCLPSLSKEGNAIFILGGAALRGMDGSYENPLRRRGGAERRRSLSDDGRGAPGWGQFRTHPRA